MAAVRRVTHGLKDEIFIGGLIPQFADDPEGGLTRPFGSLLAQEALNDVKQSVGFARLQRGGGHGDRADEERFGLAIVKRLNRRVKV
ncbi:hypothetical protein D3C85_1521200 [compost metagenome]